MCCKKIHRCWLRVQEHTTSERPDKPLPTKRREMKIVKIDMCIGCPSCEYEDSRWFCRELQKYVNQHSIHPDCPLEDAKEANDASF